jgi:hypothetical protein
MTEHIDIPLDVIDTLIMNTLAGKNAEVVGGLNAIRDLLRNPEVRSIFEINSASLIHHQMNRITELENAAEQFANDIMSNRDLARPVIFVVPFREWMKDSKRYYAEKVKGLVE